MRASFCLAGTFVAIAISLGLSAAQTLPKLGKPLKSYSVQDTTMLDAVLHLAKEEGFPLGVEFVNLEAVQKPVSVTLGATTVGGVLNAIIATGKGYRWKADHGVVLITHVGTHNGQNNLLKHVLREFVIPRCAIQEASNALQMYLIRDLRPGTRGIVGEYSPGSLQHTVGPLRMQHVTVEDVLNRLVSSDGNSAWIIQVPPGNVHHVPSSGLWRIVGYDDPALADVSKLLRRKFSGR